MGTVPNDGTGDSLRVAFTKVNAVIAYLNDSFVPSPPVVEAISFTATNGVNLVDTSSGPFTMTLPASPNVGDSVQVVDVGGIIGTHNLLTESSFLINGQASPYVMKAPTTLLFVSSIYGWVITSNAVGA